jgi:hypothetical protein
MDVTIDQSIKDKKPGLAHSADPLYRLIGQTLHPDEADGTIDGQGVIVIARWLLVASGLVLAVWSPAAIGPMRLQIFVLLLIAVANFFLHAQLLRRNRLVDRVAYVASAVDLVVITLLIESQHGFRSNLFPFYIPAILAISVAFRPHRTVIYTGATIFFYSVFCVASLTSSITSSDVQIIVIRSLTLAAIAFSGALYQSVEACRRAAA